MNFIGVSSAGSGPFGGVFMLSASSQRLARVIFAGPASIILFADPEISW
jgi:hypothetical protein